MADAEEATVADATREIVAVGAAAASAAAADAEGRDHSDGCCGVNQWREVSPARSRRRSLFSLARVDLDASVCAMAALRARALTVRPMANQYCSLTYQRVYDKLL